MLEFLELTRIYLPILIYDIKLEITDQIERHHELRRYKDGKYYINVGMNPKHKHFTEADQLFREKRVATFGMYRADTPWKVIYDPPAIWQKSQL